MPCWRAILREAATIGWVWLLAWNGIADVPGRTKKAGRAAGGAWNPDRVDGSWVAATTPPASRPICDCTTDHGSRPGELGVAMVLIAAFGSRVKLKAASISCHPFWMAVTMACDCCRLRAGKSTGWPATVAMSVTVWSAALISTLTGQGGATGTGVGLLVGAGWAVAGVAALAAA